MSFVIVIRATTVISKLLRMVMVNKVRFLNITDAVAGLNNQRLAREQDLLRDEPMNLTLSSQLPTWHDYHHRSAKCLQETLDTNL